MQWEGAALVMENIAGCKRRSFSLCLPSYQPVPTSYKTELTVSSDWWGRLVNMNNVTKERSFEKWVLLLSLFLELWSFFSKSDFI